MTKSIQLKPISPQDSRLESNQEPLYKRLPTHDENGNFLSDFMLLIPGLRTLSASLLQSRLQQLHGLLDAHPDVVFADLNAPLNLLWVSVKARHGVICELADEIRRQIPEARLVGHPVPPGPQRQNKKSHGLRRFLGRMRRNQLE